MQYVFQINTLDQKTLLPQLSQALQKRTELLSRQKYPSLWHKHDYITAQQKMPPDVLLQRRRRYRIYGIILLLLGFFLLIPALTAPKELMTPLLAGILGVVFGGLALYRSRTQNRKLPLQHRFAQSAQKLLLHQQQALPAEVCFSDEGMQLAADSVIPYAEIDCLIITTDAFLLTWQEQVVFLPVLALQNNAVSTADDSPAAAKDRAIAPGDPATCFLAFLEAKLRPTVLLADIRQPESCR